MHFKKLNKIAEELDLLGEYVIADQLDNIVTEARKNPDKWMQRATNPKEKGELHRKLNISVDKKIPTALLNKKKKQIQEKSKGDKKLSKKDRETLSQIQFALNARKANK